MKGVDNDVNKRHLIFAVNNHRQLVEGQDHVPFCEPQNKGKCLYSDRIARHRLKSIFRKVVNDQPPYFLDSETINKLTRKDTYKVTNLMPIAQFNRTWVRTSLLTNGGIGQVPTSCIHNFTLLLLGNLSSLVNYFLISNGKNDYYLWVDA
jgi:hypothetical protein